MSRLVSPYEFNPMNVNPLRQLLDDNVDFDRVRHCSDISLFISATNVHTGKVKVFKGADVTVDSVMASACLPHLFQAVVIDDVPYWDGGFAGNPVLFPFHDSCKTLSVLAQSSSRQSIGCSVSYGWALQGLPPKPSALVTNLKHRPF